MEKAERGADLSSASHPTLSHLSCASRVASDASIAWPIAIIPRRLVDSGIICTIQGLLPRFEDPWQHQSSSSLADVDAVDVVTRTAGWAEGTELQCIRKRKTVIYTRR
jgi:hypothetical protein